MRYRRNNNVTLLLIMALVGVLGTTIAFAAFSSTLTIKGEANVTPISSTFGVKFSSNSTKLETNNITLTGNGSAAIINNDGNPTIKNLNASFTSPGEKVVYKFYVLNTNGDKVNLIMDRIYIVMERRLLHLILALYNG